MLLEKRRTLPQRILRQIRIETHQSQHRVIDQSQRIKTDQSGDCNKAYCKRVIVSVGNCTRAMCVRARRCQCSSTESARSPPQRLYIPGQFVVKQCCYSWVFSTRSGFFLVSSGFLWCRLGFWVFLSVTWVFFHLVLINQGVLLYIVYRTIIRRYSIVKLLLTEGASILQNQTLIS